jgi:uncharacterized membrane protein YkoI
MNMRFMPRSCSGGHDAKHVQPIVASTRKDPPMTSTSTLRRTLLAALVTTASLGAVAQSATPAAPAAAAAPMSMMQMLERVTAQGYRDVREIEVKSDRLYEVKATNDKGQRVEMLIDARSGEVLKQEIKTKGPR